MFRVGQHYNLERVVEGLTAQEWTDDRADNGPVARLGDLFMEGGISHFDYEEGVLALQAVDRELERRLFGDPAAELDKLTSLMM